MFARSAMFVVCLAAASSSFATSPRVFVASNGIDTGACSRNAPCRNFAYAVTQVNDGGEVVALDTAGYGPVWITKSMSIYAAAGATAFIATPAGEGILVDAGDGGTVVLRNLVVTSSGSELGIRLVSGDTLKMANVQVTGFSFSGPTGSGTAIGLNHFHSGRSVRIMFDQVEAFHSQVRLFASEFGSGSSMFLTIRNSTFDGNDTGAEIQTAVSGVITDSSFNSNTSIGLEILSNDAAITSAFDIQRSTVSNNASAGIRCGCSGAGQAYARIAYTIVTRNFVGLNPCQNGHIQSRTDGSGNLTNTIEANAIGNATADTYSAK